jgi:hypothetical protein
MHDDLWSMIKNLAVVDPPGRASVARQITVAKSAGWTPAGLLEWLAGKLAGQQRISNPGGFIVACLRSIPAAPPQAALPGPGPLPPACDECLAERPGAAVNPRMRYRGAFSDGVLCECHPDHPAQAGGVSAQETA